MIRSELYHNVRYVTIADYIIGKTIYEYDIEKANISILLWKGVIDKTLYDQLYKTEKLKRQIYIGSMIKSDPKIGEILNNGIEQIRKTLFDIFSLEDYDIVSIRNDAIFFVFNGTMDTSRFNGYIDNTNKIHIVMKNSEVCVRREAIYSSFYKINKNEYFYYNGRFDKNPYINITGIDTDTLNSHMPHFGGFLMNIFGLAERDISGALTELNSFYTSYINRKLPIGMYREFNSSSRFVLAERSLGSRVYIGDIGDKISIEHFRPSLKDLDISYNEDILRQLQRVYASYYFNRH